MNWTPIHYEMTLFCSLQYLLLWNLFYINIVTPGFLVWCCQSISFPSFYFTLRVGFLLQYRVYSNLTIFLNFNWSVLTIHFLMILLIWVGFKSDIFAFYLSHFFFSFTFCFFWGGLHAFFLSFYDSTWCLLFSFPW